MAKKKKCKEKPPEFDDPELDEYTDWVALAEDSIRPDYDAVAS